MKLQLADIVVQLDNSHRLNEKRGTCGRLVVDHTWNLTFVFGFYRDTVAAVSHGDNGVLKVIAGAAVYQRGQLGVDAVIGNFHAAAYMHQTGTGVVTDFVLGNDAAADFG